eukprot:5293394-Prymnesium_polylepis.2
MRATAAEARPTHGAAPHGRRLVWPRRAHLSERQAAAAAPWPIRRAQCDRRAANARGRGTSGSSARAVQALALGRSAGA